MLNILTDGLSALGTYKEAVAIFFVVTFGLGYFIAQQISAELPAGIKLLASFSLGSIALSILTYLLVLLGYFWPLLLRPGSLVIFLLGLFLTLKALWDERKKLSLLPGFLAIGSLLFLLLTIRLAFLQRAVLPGYSDSPVHYQIVFGFLHPAASVGAKLSIANIFNEYYHFGFHSLAAWMTSLTGLAPEASISLFGQLFLVIAPLSVLFLTYVLTRKTSGALFAGLLATTAWAMPAFATNWGKFPALASLACMPAALALLWLYWRETPRRPRLLFWVITLLIGITLLHTRIVFCVLLASLSFFLADKMQTKQEIGFAQALRLSLLYALSLLPLSMLLNDFYMNWPVLIVCLLLLPFAFQAHPKLSVGIFFYTFGIWLIVLAPSLVIKNFPDLLDRPFLEIMLYIPFAVMTGAGFGGLMKLLPSARMWKSLAVTALIVGVTLNFMQGRSIYPDACCDYYTEEDRLAFQWLRDNASERTLIFIPTYREHGLIIGTDAGIWIAPLLGKNTNKLRYDFDWESANKVNKICNPNAQEMLIYAGGRPFSFSNVKLSQAQWIKPVFTSTKTIIYQITECPP
jgi:hypothetical protein